MSVTLEMLQVQALQRMAQSMSDDIVDAIAAKVAKAARAEWIRLAAESGLSTTRQNYINGIQKPYRVRKGTYRISLVGKLPNLIELGMPVTDLRETLLGPNVPVVPQGQPGGKKENASGGFYRSIPFSHAGPTATGAAGVAPMGRAYSGKMMAKEAKAMGRDVYAQAKELAAYTDPKASASDKRLGNPMMSQGKGKSRKEVFVPKLKPHHHTSVYSGMIRQEQQTKSKPQSTYTTFRTISTDVTVGADGKTANWIRPATQGKHLAAKVSEFVARQAPMAFEEYVKGLKG